MKETEKTFEMIGQELVSRGLLTKDLFDMANAPEHSKQIIPGLYQLGIKNTQGLLTAISNSLNFQLFSQIDSEKKDLYQFGSSSSSKKWFVYGNVFYLTNPLDYVFVEHQTKKFDEEQRTIAAVGLVGEEQFRKVNELYNNNQSAFSADQEELDEESQKKASDQLIDNIVETAFSRGASDIHISPGPERYRVDYRVDGQMSTGQSNDMQQYKNLSNRLMSRAKLKEEVTEPKSGDFQFRLTDNEVRKIRFEMAPIQVEYNEKLKKDQFPKFTLRILGNDKILKLDEIGLPEAHLNFFREVAHRENGLFLVTGPTGSGKSTTLDALLLFIRELFPKSTYYSMEQPVETIKEGIWQIPLSDTEHGTTSIKAIRSILRHDPDVVMIGEIRDFETAALACQLANTGHLVLGTLHTNNSHMGIDRLIELGIEPSVINQVLIGASAQRLLPKICKRCRKVERISEVLDKNQLEVFERSEISEYLSIDNKAGFKNENPECTNCGGVGFKGRKMINEIFFNTEKTRKLIKDKVLSQEIRDIQKQDGHFVPLIGHLGLAINKGECDLQSYRKLNAEKDNPKLLSQNSVQAFINLMN